MLRGVVRGCGCAALLLLALAAPSTHAAENEALLAKYDPTAGVDDWGVADVKAWVLKLEVPCKEAAETLAQAGVDGPQLLALNQHHLDDDLKLIPIQRLHILRGLDRLKHRIRHHPNDFWEWRAGHRRYADVLAAGLTLAPRATIYWMHMYEEMLIKDTPIKKLQVDTYSGYEFWTAWLLCPRLEIAFFVSKFDTHHPDLVQHVWITGVALTAIEWLTWILLITPYIGRKKWIDHSGNEKKKWPNPFGGALFAGAYWTLYPLIPHEHTDTYFNAAVYALPYLLVLLGVSSVLQMTKTALTGGIKDD